jgi:hypothetical protein
MVDRSSVLPQTGGIRLYIAFTPVNVGQIDLKARPVFDQMTAERQSPTKLFRFAISILVIGHLLAVLLPPLSFQARGPLGLSPSVATLLAPVEGYGQFLYIDRGYAFFAPDPGPSHLIQAAITDSSGQRIEQMYPDREQQWPRLLYHRHFMLSEFMDEIYQPPGPPQELIELDREEAELWVRSRARYEHVRQSVVEHLKAENPGHDIAIRRIEHLIPDVIEFQREPIALTDQRLYQVILDQPVTVSLEGDLAAPARAETIPPPVGAAVERDGEKDADKKENTSEGNERKNSHKESSDKERSDKDDDLESDSSNEPSLAELETDATSEAVGEPGESAAGGSP